MSLFKTSIKNEGTKPTRYYSKKQENSIATAVGGKTTPNSGATMWKKGDITTDNWLLEAKTKTKDSDSISIKKEWITKNKEESIFMDKEYCGIVINFGPGQPNYYIIDELTFQELLELQNK